MTTTSGHRNVNTLVWAVVTSCDIADCPSEWVEDAGIGRDRVALANVGWTQTLKWEPYADAPTEIDLCPKHASVA